MVLLFFLEKQLKEYEKAGDTIRATKLKIIIREFRAMLDEEQQSLTF
jgi:hypothetical protein